MNERYSGSGTSRSMRRAKKQLTLTTISLEAQAAGSERNYAENEDFVISETAKGVFTVFNRQTGQSISFVESQTILQTELSSGRTYLIWLGLEEKKISALPMTDKLISALKAYLGVSFLDTSELSGRYRITTDSRTGIQSLHLNNAGCYHSVNLILTRKDLEHLEKLARKFKEQYPNLIQNSDKYALFLAESEIAGTVKRTKNGFLIIRSTGVEFEHNQNARYSWKINFDHNQMHDGLDFVYSVCEWAERMTLSGCLEQMEKWEEYLQVNGYAYAVPWKLGRKVEHNYAHSISENRSGYLPSGYRTV